MEIGSAKEAVERKPNGGIWGSARRRERASAMLVFVRKPSKSFETAEVCGEVEVREAFLRKSSLPLLGGLLRGSAGNQAIPDMD